MKLSVCYQRHFSLSCLLLLSVTSAAVLPVACGEPVFIRNIDGDTSNFPGGVGGAPDVDGDLDVPFVDVPGADTPMVDHSFEIVPSGLVLDNVQPGQTVKFTAYSNTTHEPVDISFWYLDKAYAGSVDSNGLFTASGVVGGVVVVGGYTSRYSATTTLTLGVETRDIAASIDDATINALRGGQANAGVGNTPDSSFRWLYPYDGTVFPRNVPSPVVQMAGGGADAYYLRIRSEWFAYEGFFGGRTPERFVLPESAWRGLTWSAGAGDPVRVELTKISGGNVSGPVAETWTVAQASLKGILYYNTYDDPHATQGGTLNEAERGAVMRIRPGERSPDLLLGGDGTCATCHSVSANGQRMVLSAGHTCNKSFALSAAGDATEVFTDDCSRGSRHDDTLSFGGLTPDGSLVLTSGSMVRETSLSEFYPNIASIDDDTGPRDSMLMSTDTGEAISALGFDGVVRKALMPAFSPDGRKIAFVHYEVGMGRTLSVMDFDISTRTFSNLREVFSTVSLGDGDLYVGWPSFTPDGHSIVFQVGNRRDYSTWREGSGRLFVVSVDTLGGGARSLALLNGRRGNHVYVGAHGEDRLSFEPTVLPVAVGGYYWVVFTSRRSYGNLITESGEGPSVPTPARPSPKKLWVAALDIGSIDGADASHPAFYLEGQDLVSGNMRGFWTMEPCKPTGAICESGSDCCDGFCRIVETVDGTSLMCVEPPTDDCSVEYERCETDGDCCEADDDRVCINGFCSRPTPILK